jgi:hypothetical protein
VRYRVKKSRSTGNWLVMWEGQTIRELWANSYGYWDAAMAMATDYAKGGRHLGS